MVEQGSLLSQLNFDTGGRSMIECDLTYDLLPGVDMKGYVEWAKKTIGTMGKQPGMF